VPSRIASGSLEYTFKAAIRPFEPAVGCSCIRSLSDAFPAFQLKSPPRQQLTHSLSEALESLVISDLYELLCAG
jgi:hypothetical protein